MANCLYVILNKAIPACILCILIMVVSLPTSHARGGKSATSQMATLIENNQEDIFVNSEHIEANKKNIEVNKEGEASNAEHIETNKENIVANVESIEANKKNIEVNKEGVASNAEHIETNKENIVANVESIETNKKNIEVNKEGVASNAEHIETNKANAEINKGNIASHSEQIKSNHGNIATNAVNIQVNKNSVNDIKKNIEFIDESLKNTVENSANNQNKITSNQSEINTNQSEIKTNQAEIKTIQSQIQANQANIKANQSDIKIINTELKEFGRGIRGNTADIASQKSLIEDNSIRLYDILVKTSKNTEILDGFSETLDGVKASQSSAPQTKEKKIIANINRLWMFLIIILASAVPLAFALINNHSPSRQNQISQTSLSHNTVLVWFAAFFGYFVVGFGLMYGNTSSGWIGSVSYPWLSEQATEGMVPTQSAIEFLLFQSSFAALFALLIVFMLGNRLSLFAQVMLALFAGMLIFPVLGHWTWAGHFIPGNQGWLQAMGFIDNAGATLVHSAAAWFALVLVWQLSRGKHEQQKTAEISIYPGFSIFLLWLGLMGLSAGMLSISSETVTVTLLNITLATSSAGMTLFLYQALFRKQFVATSIVSCGFVSGLVAISAVSTMVTPFEALLIGVIAAMVQTVGFALLRRTALRKPEQTRVAALIAAHGFAGVWGTLSVALFGTEGEFSAPDFTQLTTQGIGIAAVFLYSIAIAWVIMLLFNFYRKFKRVNAVLSSQAEAN